MKLPYAFATVMVSDKDSPFAADDMLFAFSVEIQRISNRCAADSKENLVLVEGS